MLKELLSEKLRFLKFLTVGVSGTVINLSLVWFGNSVVFFGVAEPLQTWLSYGLAIFVSITSNFVLNYHWTWRDRRGCGTKHFFLHLLKYYLTNLVAASIQFSIASIGVYLLTVSFLEVGAIVPVYWKMGAGLVGIGTAGVVNFLVNHFWNFNVSNNKKNDEE